MLATYASAVGHEPEVLVRAPGRNTAIGDHLDYPPLPQDGSATSHTIAWATPESVWVAASRRADRQIALHAVSERQSFTVSLDDVESLATAAARTDRWDVRGQPPPTWARSVLALLYSAMRGVPGIRPALPVHGAAFAFEGDVPQGAGQASSAAFLVAMTLACNEVFGWGIPLDHAFVLADIARSGEHEDYSPFIAQGRAGYLDQMVSLTAREGKAVVIDHGNYQAVDWIDLDVVEELGYRNVVVLSGLSRALGETDYPARVEELTRLPVVLNHIVSRRHASWAPRSHVYQFSYQEWTETAADLDAEAPILAQRARYVFEERERSRQFRDALAAGSVEDLVSLVNASGEAMSMTGPYQITGYNEVPREHRRLAALDALRAIVLRHAGPSSAARMIGGGGAGPLYVLAPAAVADAPAFALGITEAWRALTGLTARVTMDSPGRGAEIVWRQSAPRYGLR